MTTVATETKTRQFLSLDIHPVHGDRSVQPEGTEYLIVDQHNDRKGHHIIVTDDGETYYNQAIWYPTQDPRCQTERGGWQDFYEWEFVGTLQRHGYRNYIDAALLKHAGLEVQ